jgi:preprotein translocase SecE subunit
MAKEEEKQEKKAAVKKEKAKKEKQEKKATVKKEKTKKEKKKKESYIKGVRKELKLVKWPTFKEVIKYTLATIVFCVVLSCLFMLLNLLLSVVKGWLA